MINIDHGYVHRKENFEFIDGIFELVAEANRAGYVVIVVTNQAGIGRGYYTEDDFTALMNWVGGEFIARGGRIDGVYYCPDHPEHGVGKYRRESNFRKPGPGMLIQAAHDWKIDLPQSVLIGDKLSDMEAGRSAEVGTLLFLSGEACDLVELSRITNLAEAANFLITECNDGMGGKSSF